MIIDSLKGSELYKSIVDGNRVIEKSGEGYTFTSEEYDLPNKKLSWWFDYRCVKDLAISAIYPLCLPVQKDPKFCLHLYAPNYFSLLLINTLYENKEIKIEDQCGGRGDLFVYLKRMGFKNFHLVDNFTQLPEDLFRKLMELDKINPELNNDNYIPDVLNLVGYTYFVKPILPETELVIVYNNTRIIHKKEDGTFEYLYQNLDAYTPLENKVLLAVEKHGLTKAYCNKQKLEEFQEKLRKYEVA